MLAILLMASYFVANGGSDSNNGTSSGTAWQTIAHVNAQAFSPGDTVSFNGGDTFTGTLTITNSGSAGNPIMFNSYGTGKAIISAGNQRGVYIKSVSYITVQNLKVSGVGVVPATGLMSDGSTNFLYAFDVESTLSNSTLSNIKILNCQATGCFGGFFVHCDAASTPVGYSTVEIGGSIADPLTVTECLGCGIYVYGSEVAANSGSPFFLATGRTQHSSVHLHHFDISHVYACPSATYSVNNYSGSGIVLSNTTTGTIEYGYVHTNGHKNDDSRGGPVGIMTIEADTITVQYCEVFDERTTNTDGLGIDHDGGSINCICQYNYVHGNVASPFATGTFGGSSSTSGNTFQYNICEGNGGTAAVHSFGSFTGPLVQRNTFNHVPAGDYGVLNGGGQGWTFKNNVVITTGSTKVLAHCTNTGGGSDVFQGNTYFSQSGNPRWTDDTHTNSGSPFTTIAGFRSSTNLIVPPETLGGSAVGQYTDPQLSAIGSGGTIANIGSMNTLLTAYDPTGGSTATSNAGVGSTPSAKDFHQKNSSAGFVPVGAVYANESSTIGISRTRLQVGM